MKVLLAGSTGAIGLPLIARLRADGHQVAAIHRGEGGREVLRGAGVEPVSADVLDRAGLLAATEGLRCEAVISELTALKKPPLTHRDMAMTNRLRTEGTANLLQVAARVGARRFVTQSMVFGYGYRDFGQRVLTEAEPFGCAEHIRFDPHLAAMRDNERQVFDADHVEGIALRRRRLPIIRDGGVRPWVYIDDAVAATAAALEHGHPDSAYNIADDQSVSFGELITAMAAAIGAPPPRVVPSWLLSALPYAKAVMTANLRVATDKAHQQLGRGPTQPTYQEGLAALGSHYRRAAA